MSVTSQSSQPRWVRRCAAASAAGPAPSMTIGVPRGGRQRTGVAADVTHLSRNGPAPAMPANESGSEGPSESRWNSVIGTTVADTGSGQVIESTTGDTEPAVVSLRGEIGTQLAEPLEDCVAAALDRCSDVIVDLIDVSLIGDAALRVLVQASPVAARRGRRIRLARPSRSARRTLAAAGLHDTFAAPAGRLRAV